MSLHQELPLVSDKIDKDIFKLKDSNIKFDENLVSQYTDFNGQSRKIICGEDSDTLMIEVGVSKSISTPIYIPCLGRSGVLSEGYITVTFNNGQEMKDEMGWSYKNFPSLSRIIDDVYDLLDLDMSEVERKKLDDHLIKYLESRGRVRSIRFW